MIEKEERDTLVCTPDADAKIDNSLQNEEESLDNMQDSDSSITHDEDMPIQDDDGMGNNGSEVEDDIMDEDLLMQDIQRIVNETQESIGVFSIKQANKVMSEAKERPDPVPLFDKLWYEHELCCLFADSNLGKSIFAIQMAEKIAHEGRKVVYFDFEMSDKAFQVRYTTRDGLMHTFADSFYRAEVDRDRVDEHFDENLLSQIEVAMVESFADVVIIDNLTWICAESEKGGDAAKLMMSLKNIWKKHNYPSMLIVAHTPKRDMSRPITANDLAGSRKIYNFFDSVIAIGRSAKDENLRYIKQVKVRTGGFSYDTENVIVCSIEQDSDGFLHFASQGYATEREHLRTPSERDVAALKERVFALYQEGRSYRDIAYTLGISKSYVCKILKGK